MSGEGLNLQIIQIIDTFRPTRTPLTSNAEPHVYAFSCVGLSQCDGCRVLIGWYIWTALYHDGVDQARNGGENLPTFAGQGGDDRASSVQGYGTCYLINKENDFWVISEWGALDPVLQTYSAPSLPTRVMDYRKEARANIRGNS